jgi:metal transporter CNNM
MSAAIWLGICLCITQSAIFSGLNLAVFSVSKLRLEVLASTGNREAAKVLRMRQQSNLLLTTILWGNVGINVLLTLLSNSVLAGIGAFLFSTIAITFIGEIFPQAYFSRNALKMASILSPILKVYQIVLYPVTKPTAMMLDWWLGAEGVQYFRERDLREVIKKHIHAKEADVGHLEGIGALNFLDIDDLMVVQEGEPIDPKSIITLPMTDGLPDFGEFARVASDPFLKQIEASGKKWTIVVDSSGKPHFVLDADGFLRSVFFNQPAEKLTRFFHRPIIVSEPTTRLGKVIWELKVCSQSTRDEVIDRDIILVWGEEKRIITGADILGRLLRGIATA